MQYLSIILFLFLKIPTQESENNGIFLWFYVNHSG